MKQGRTFLVVSLIVAILATGLVQSQTLSKRRAILRTSAGGSGQSLANMDSFALALLLGGLRGPLVMFLWTQSESQKISKNLEGVETQIEWIRLLQPEFDTVHLFQIWNKAYNISVQMASLANKYSVILDAIDYARSVGKERPDDINLVSAIGGIFNDKLSGSAEKVYYRKRVRQDTKYRAQIRVDRVAGVRPTQYDSILDEQGNVRPELLQPRFPIPTTGRTTAEGIENYYDGSELQFLNRYEPFPYGVSPTGLAYNYLKRAQMLQRDMKQKHLQISEMVVDSRPGLTLQSWGEEEMEIGTRAEARYWGIEVPSERFAVMAATAGKAPVTVSDAVFAAKKADYDEAIYQFTLTDKVLRDALAEMKSHIANPDYASHADLYRSHLEHMAALRLLNKADEAYLKATRASGEQRQALLAEAKEAYHQSAKAYAVVRIRYFTSPEMYENLFPANIGRWNFDELPEAQIFQILKQIDARLASVKYDTYEDDNREYNTYINRAQTRLTLLAKQ